MSFVHQQIKQIHSGGLPVLWRKISAFPQWLGSKISDSKVGILFAYFINTLAVAFKPDSAKAYERLGSTLFSLNRFEEGLTLWKKAISLQTDDRYPELFKQSVALLHRGQWDTMISALRMGAEAQDEFARKHQLDKLGIRFLREWTYAIGHMALLDIYVKMGILGWRNQFRPIVLDDKPANRCYLDYWRQYLPYMITDPVGVKLLTPLATRLEDHLRVITFADGRRLNYLAAILEVQQQWEKEGRGPLLTLKDSDHEWGWECLKRFGMKEGDWFVGLHVRATASKNARDSDIDTYRMAIESITARGGWVIRMGNPSMPPLATMPRVIDYAHSEARCDSMDVFLWARCRFFIGTQSGPYLVPSTFGVPCVMINSFPMALSMPYQNISIYKLYRSEKENRLMTFSEACASRVELAESLKYISSTGVRLVDNTPEEINDVVLEIMERLEGKIVYSAEDEELQKRFKSLKLPFTNQFGTSADRIGRAFLQKYTHLL